MQWEVLVLFGCKQSIATDWTAVFECAIGGPMSSIESVDVGNAVKMLILGRDISLYLRRCLELGICELGIYRYGSRSYFCI